MKSTLIALLLTASAFAAAPTVNVTDAEVEQMLTKVRLASRVFNDTWTEAFRAAGRSYPAPRILSYYGKWESGCGETIPNNAFYCTKDNNIYFDKVFLTKMMKGVGGHLGTDGDLAPIIILAHEMGHGVATVLKLNFSYSIHRENLADCLAGVLMKVSNELGYLERGDLDEAHRTLEISADDAKTHILSDHAHGTAAERRVFFDRGYAGGLPACNEQLASILIKQSR